MNTYVKLFCALLVGVQIGAMDSNNKVTLVDSNKDQKLSAAVPNDSQVCVFGATPRYSFFKKCMTILKQHLETLDAAYAKNKRLKGVQKSIKQIVHSFKQAHPEESIAENFDRLSQEEQFKLFFMIGFNHEIMKENMAELCNCASHGGSRSASEDPKTLVHLLLPIYYDNCAKYQPSIETIHAFLMASALFYKKAYELTEDAPDTIIYIPPLKYFIEVLSRFKDDDMLPQDKSILIAKLIKAELFDKLPQTKLFVLINPNADQLKAFFPLLLKAGIESDRIKMVELMLMHMLKRTKSFAPYTLKFKEEDLEVDFKTSPLITEDLANLLSGGGA